MRVHVHIVLTSLTKMCSLHIDCFNRAYITVITGKYRQQRQLTIKEVTCQNLDNIYWLVQGMLIPIMSYEEAY